MKYHMLFGLLLTLEVVLLAYSYIAKTLYGDDDEEDTLQRNTNVDEPKLIGHHPASNEKVLLLSHARFNLMEGVIS